MNNSADTQWFNSLVNFSDVSVCFTTGRISFVDAGGKESKKGNTKGQVFFYFGDNHEEFERVFSEHGNTFE